MRKGTSFTHFTDFFVVLGVTLTTALIVIFWSKLSPIALVTSRGIYTFLEKDTILYANLFLTLFHTGLAYLVRTPSMIRMLWTVTDENRKAQLRISRQAHNWLRLQLVLALNGSIIGAIGVSMGYVRASNLLQLEQVLTVTILISWGLHVYWASQYR